VEFKEGGEKVLESRFQLSNVAVRGDVKICVEHVVEVEK